MILFIICLSVNVFAGTLSIVSVDSLSGNPGDSLDFSLIVENQGAELIEQVDVVSSDLAFNNNKIPAPVINSLLDIANNSQSTQTFTVQVPSLPAGVYQGSITVMDKNDSDNNATQTYTLTINPVDDFEVGSNSIKIVGQPDTVKTINFNVKNTGSQTLTFSFETENEFKDDDYDTIGISFSSLDPVAPGETAIATITADIDRMFDVGLYNTKVKVTGKNNGDEVVKEFDLAIEVEPQICSNGAVGDLVVVVEEPDDGEEFYPGEEMIIDAKVYNYYSRDVDAVVKAVLYDATENEKILTVESDDFEVDEDEHENIELKLEIPTTSSLDEDDDYYLYVKAYKKGDEDEHCDVAKVKVDIERKDNDVVVKKFNFDKDETVCGETVYATVTVENVGNDDQNQVYITLESDELNIKLESDMFSLGDYNDADNSHIETFTFALPAGSDVKDYTFYAIVHYDDESNLKLGTLTLTECNIKPVTEAAVLMTVEDSTITLKPGKKKFVIPFILENTGGKPIEISVDIKEASGWAEITDTETPKLLNPGDKYHAYVYMKLKNNVAEGLHSFRLNVRRANHDGVLQSKLLSVDVPFDDATTPSRVIQQAAEDLTWFSSILSDKGKLAWVIGDVLLVLVALIFIRMLLKKP